MRKRYVIILLGIGMITSGTGGFFLGAATGGAIGGTAGVVEGVNQGSLVTANYIANNSDAQYVAQGNGDLTLYVPNATDQNVEPSRETGYTPVLYYNNSSGTWDNFPIRQYAADNMTNTTSSTPTGTETLSLAG